VAKRADMAPFTAHLDAVQRRANSALCVGLDIDPRRMPAGIPPDAEGLRRFVQGIVEATADVVCAYKPNLGFFEALGEDGFALLRDTLDCIPASVITIADGKRGDIGSSAERYAAAVFEVFDFDAITINPYQGSDSIEPYIADPARGGFVLCKTSNPGSADYQDLHCIFEGNEMPLYEVVARKTREMAARGNVGLVVGATYPDELARVRALAPELPILIPGVGTQGGDAAESIRMGSAENGMRAVVNVGRQVLYASSGDDWQDAARREATALRDSMRLALAVE